MNHEQREPWKSTSDPPPPASYPRSVNRKFYCDSLLILYVVLFLSLDGQRTRKIT